MDKNAIKKYAVWARTELIDRVSQKALQYGITEKHSEPASATAINGVVLSKEEMTQRKALLERIAKNGYKQVMEEVAYTWFNRFSALRFMEVNGYLPSRVRVFTDENNQFKPQIITEAINLELDGLNMEKVYALKDANDDEGLFKYLIIVQCNALSPIMPGMFQRIDDFTELLFPDNLLRDGSAVQRMIEWIPEEDWKDAVQIIGWLYQFYNIEPKAEVFAKNGKISKEEIPAATQLFTPDWIVRYMVENSLGRLWVEGHPNDDLKSEWKYYLGEAEQEPDVQAQLAKIRKEYAGITPETIKCIDPCSGSGHILAYMFDVLMQIYEAYGYTAREAVQSIVENNIYGLDIDERAAQLAYFSVMMKARQYDRRFLTRKDEDGNPDVPQPHVYEIQESNGLDRTAIEYFVGDDKELKKAMDTLVSEMHDAKEYGSILNITQVDFAALYRRFDEVLSDISIFNITIERDLLPIIKIAEVLSHKYDVVVTNPPYMSVSATGVKLAEYIKKNFPDSKTDLYSVFIDRCKTFTKRNRFQAMITMHSWMFLGSFERLREKYIFTDTVNMAHLGARAFEEIGGEVVQTTSFVLRNSYTKNYITSYCRLVNGDSQDAKEKLYLDHSAIFFKKQSAFQVIPGIPIAYWLSDAMLKVFEYPKLSVVGETREGVTTANNDLFLKLWFEVDRNDICMDCSSHEMSENLTTKWYPHHKGGEYRKWYGNCEYVVFWHNGANAIRNYKDEATGRIRSHNYNLEYNFKEYATWSRISSENVGLRYSPPGFVFDSASAGLFLPKNILKYGMGFICSKIAKPLLLVLNPTIKIQPGDVADLPLLVDKKQIDTVDALVTDNIALSKDEWDSFETSWDFIEHPLIRISHDLWDATAVGASMHYYYGSHPKVSCPLELCYMLWQGECNERFKNLKANEEELNRIFIDIYGLQDELTPEVNDDDVTVRKADLKRDIKSLISYAVGCMFGRYSLDVPGLAYAGGEWDDSKYTSFKADKDSIIPICDDEYFTDDIVGRFIRFIEVVYGKGSLNDNLKFIADALGGSGQPKDVIRKYFMDEFYADHLKTYQKRPIYWLFDSGKKGGFRALVYMHRYQPDTIARMRTDYVHEQQSRYRTAIADLEQRISSASTSERVKLSKRLKTLQEQATEIQSYEEKIHHLADQYISIDLDDGVKVNYEKFQDVLAKIK
ncbi:MAG: BREX-1 system adenine-specific DNA-methyltransferase PglX [Clostridiales bacterium]|nr:BREX-1 system adenine-specific DNA-methyltransferase PglX [Clostridiales bacterium]